MEKSQEQIPRSKFQLPAVTFHTPSLTSSPLLFSQSGNHLDLSVSHFLHCILNLTLVSFFLIPSPAPASLLIFSPFFLHLLRSILSLLDCQGLLEQRVLVLALCGTLAGQRYSQPALQRKWKILQMGWDDSTCFQSGITLSQEYRRSEDFEGKTTDCFKENGAWFMENSVISKYYHQITLQVLVFSVCSPFSSLSLCISSSLSSVLVRLIISFSVCLIKALLEKLRLTSFLHRTASVSRWLC